MITRPQRVTREAQRGVSHPLLLLLSVGEQLADVGLGLAHVLVEDLGAVDDLWFAGVEHLADLPGHQRFTTARGPEEQDTLHVLAPWSDGAAQREREKRRKDAEGHRRQQVKGKDGRHKGERSREML